MKKNKRLLINWGLVLGWCSLIFLFSSLPKTQVTGVYWQEFVIKKTAHIIEYGILYLLVFRAFNYEKKKKNFWLPLVFTIVYGISDETHQLFVPGREGRLRDVIFDALGGLLALLILLDKHLKPRHTG